MNTVTVICPNNHRVSVKADQKTTFAQILNEACKRQGFDPDKHELRRQGKPVDLSLTFRLSGFPNNVTLDVAELAEGAKPSIVEVAIQLPSGERISSHFRNDQNLWEIMKQMEEQKNFRLFALNDASEHPALQYLNEQIVTSKALEHITLKKLGIRDRVLFRYASRKLSDEELAKIHAKIEDEKRHQTKLQERFEAKKEQLKSADEQAAKMQMALDNQNFETVPAESNASNFSSEIVQNSSDSASASSKRNQPDEEMLKNLSGSRLERLEYLRKIVDGSLESGSELPWDIAESPSIPVSNMAFSTIQESSASYDESLQNVSNQSEFANFKFPEATKGQDLISAIMNENEKNSTSNYYGAALQDRKPVLYRKDEESQPNEVAAEPSDEFFELTTNDVQLMLKRMQESKNRALVTQEYVRNQNDIRRREAYKLTVVRILFAERLVLQGTFRSTEPVAHLYDFVRSCLSCDIKFELVLPPNEVLSQMDKQLIEAHLSPSSIMLFRPKENATLDGGYLKSTVIAQLQSAKDAALIAQNCLSQNTAFVPYVPVIANEEGNMDTSEASFSVAHSSVTPSGQLPKWLKTGRK